jgi:hypothetical protein
MIHIEDYVHGSDFDAEVKRLERIIEDQQSELKDSDHDIEYYADIICKMNKLLENFESVDDDVKQFLEDYQFVLHNIERNRK